MPNHIEVAIAEIEHNSNTGISFDELVKLVSKLIALAPISIGSIHEPGVKLYRGTKHHVSVPIRIEDIWFPPVKHVREFGRANRPGAPLFYCCSDPNGAFREIGANIGNFAVLATWVTTKRMILHDLGFSQQVLDRAGSRRKLPEHHQHFNEQLDEKTRAVRDFIARSFTDPTSHNYQLTAAIAHVFLAGDDISGIMYPSVAKQANVDNLAIMPEFVQSCMKLEEALAVRVDQISTDGSIGGNIVARLKSADNGDLRWNFTGDSETTIPPFKGVAMWINPGERKVFTSASEIRINGRTYRVAPGDAIELVNGEVCVRNVQGHLVEASRD